MSKKAFALVLVFALFSAFPLFAGGAKATNSVADNSASGGITAALISWDMKQLDLPLITGVSYFSNTYWRFYGIALIFAQGLGVLTIIWTAFKLWIGTEQVRKSIVDIGCKFMLYTVLITIYPSVTNGILEVAIDIGTRAGGGYENIINAIAGLKTKLENQVKVAQETVSNMLSTPITLEETDYYGNVTDIYASKIPPVLTETMLEEFIKDWHMNEQSMAKYVADNNITIISDTKTGTWYSAERANYNQLYNQAKAFNEMKRQEIKSTLGNDQSYVFNTLQAIREVMTDVDPADPTKKGATKNISFDPFIKANKGSSTTRYLSPGGMIKIAVLITDIMTRRETIEYNPVSKTWLSKKFETLWYNINYYIMSFLMTIGILAAAIFFCIQYIMCIFEYYICTSLGVIFIPFVLFDGTKSFTAKLVTLFSSYFIKIVVMILCVFWAFSAFLEFGESLLSNPRPITMLDFAYFLFTLMLTWVVTQNGPQIAVTILNGSPQLSMGEFVHAAGTAAAGAMMARKAAVGMAGVAGGAGKAAQGAVRGAQTIGAELHGAAAYGKMFSNEGRSGGFGAAVSYLGGRAAQDVKSAVGAKLTGVKGESLTKAGGQLSQATLNANNKLKASGQGSTMTGKDARNNAENIATAAYKANNPASTGKRDSAEPKPANTKPHNNFKPTPKNRPDKKIKGRK
jgi:type IV secretion system protein TrbL